MVHRQREEFKGAMSEGEKEDKDKDKLEGKSPEDVIEGEVTSRSQDKEKS